MLGCKTISNWVNDTVKNVKVNYQHFGIVTDVKYDKPQVTSVKSNQEETQSNTNEKECGNLPIREYYEKKK